MKTIERLPPLNGLKVFEAVARHQSMVAAAAELHLTHGAVSRQIKQLERHLNVALFVRRNRGIFLTHEGDTLRAACVCAPVLWQRHLAVEHMPRLHTTSRPRAWLSWLLGRGGWVESMGGELNFEHFYLTLQAASAGLGAAIASQYMVEQDVRDGQLMAPFGFVEDGSAYCAVSAIPFEEDSRKVLFLNWLREEFDIN